MRKLLIVFACLAPVVAAQPQTKFLAAPSDGIQGEYLVVLDDLAAGKTEGLKAAPRRSMTAAVDSLLDDYGGELVRVWRQVLPAFLIRLPADAARDLAADSRVRWVEQNRLLPAPPKISEGLFPRPLELGSRKVLVGKSCAGVYCQPIDCPDPESPDCMDNWGLDRIDANPGDGIYEYNATGFGVHYFVLDRGLLRDHSEFSGRVQVGFDKGEECDPAACDIGERATNSHGSRVSSIAGGVRYGVAKDVFFHPVILYEATDDVLEAFEWIVAHRELRNLGPAVINASFNYPKLTDDPEYDPVSHPYCISLAARNVVEDHGIPIVTSAGNRSTSPLDFSPSDMGFVDGIIVVGGIDHQDKRWVHNDPGECVSLGTCGSNRGPGIDLWAPAHQILAATSDGSDDPMETAPTPLSGTSFAAPHVTGAVALYLQQNPEATPAQVEDAIVFNASTPDPPLDDIGDSPNLLLSTGFIVDNSGANIPPVARDDDAATPEGEEVEIDVLYNDLDPDGSSLEVLAVENPQGGTAAIQPGGRVLLYTPDPGFTGVDGFTYTIRDEDLRTAMGTVTVTVNANLPPVALDDHLVGPSQDICDQCPVNGICFATNEVLGNDIDPESKMLTFMGFSSGSLTKIECNLGYNRWQFVPSSAAPNTEVVTYTVEDAFGQQATASLYLTTSTSSEHPEVIADFFYVDEGMARSLDVLENDSDGLSIESLTAPHHGTAVISASDRVLYTPEPDFIGFDGFTYLARDAEGHQAAASVTVEVGGNLAPIARHDCLATDVGEVLSFEIKCISDVDECRDLLGNDVDPDGDPLSIVGFTTPGVGEGTLTLNGSTFRYTPPVDWEGEAHFTYTISDGKALAAGPVVIGVGDLFPPDDSGNNPPLCQSDSFATSRDEPLAILFSQLLANDSDPDGDGLTVDDYDRLTAQGGSNGVDHLFGFTYTPPPGFTGEDTFSYTISDREDGTGLTDECSVTVTVTDVLCNPPASGDWLVTQDCALQGTATAPANVIVQNGATLTIASTASLDVDFVGYHLLVREGSRAIVKQGGKIH